MFNVNKKNVIIYNLVILKSILYKITKLMSINN